jgi:hypothetical protein
VHKGEHCCAHDGCDFRVPGHSADCPSNGGSNWRWAHNHLQDRPCASGCRRYEESPHSWQPNSEPDYINMYEPGHNHLRGMTCARGCAGYIDPHTWQPDPEPDYTNMYEPGHNHLPSVPCAFGCPGWL